MAIKGLTGAPIHRGSLFGLPDIGASEKIAKLLGNNNLTDQGGSTLGIGSGAARTINSIYEKSIPPIYQNKTSVGVLGTNTGGNVPTNKALPIGGTNNTAQNTAPTNNTSQFTDPEGGTWNNQGDFNSAIDSAYGSSYDYLNNLESQTRSALPGQLDQIGQGYDLNSKMLTDQNTSNMNQFGMQRDQAGQANETQSAQIRRLYNELGQGYGQRFGGSTSAGQAASEIANVEQQRQTGQLAQKYNDTMRQIQTQQADVKTKYDNGLLQLQQQKQQSISTAQSEFQQRLNDISSKRIETDQAKASQRLSALMDLRNKVFTIEQQNIQFQQTLQAQKQAAELGIQQYSQQSTQGLGATGQATNTFSNQAPASTNLQTNKISTTSGANPYVGNMTQNNRDDQRYPWLS